MTRRRRMTEEQRGKARAKIEELILRENLSTSALTERGYPMKLIQEVRQKLRRRSPRKGHELLTDADMAEAKPPYQTRQFVRTDGGRDDVPE